MLTVTSNKNKNNRYKVILENRQQKRAREEQYCNI